MFENLKNELRRKSVSLKSFAEFLGVSEKTIQNKLKGVTPFTYPEVIRTCELLFPEYNIKYLFSTKDQAS